MYSKKVIIIKNTQHFFFKEKNMEFVINDNGYEVESERRKEKEKKSHRFCNFQPHYWIITFPLFKKKKKKNTNK